jgi:hypothetical protein
VSRGDVPDKRKNQEQLMEDKSVNHSRRHAVKLIVGGAASIPLASLVTTGSATAAELPKLDESNPMAASLQYKHDATQAPRTDKPGTPAAEQVCANCQLGQGEGEWIGCSIFPGNRVSANGWCTAWVKRAG